MKTLLQSLYLEAYARVFQNEEGQDLIEYALTIVLVALACVAGINGVASAINNVFSNISTSLQ
jgi:Flp pilus assembly pilin Flp